MERDKGKIMQVEPKPGWEPRYTIRLEGRDPERCPFTIDEARAMYAAGLRFTCFDEAMGEYRLSLPYRTRHNLDRDTLTIEQF